MAKQCKYSFQISPEQEERAKALPRAVKLAEDMRSAFEKILQEKERIYAPVK